MLKRIFDIFFSFLGLIVLFIPFLFIAFLISIDSKGGVFYKQTRVGKDGIDFKLFKFRSMRTDADKSGLLTVGGTDSRITRIGYTVRKYKIDELPQLINVLMGEMSLVGPRPEVRRYVDMYTPRQRQVLSLKPGITDYASLEFINENELLALSKEPEKTYINDIMPKKLALNLKYIKEQNLLVDLKIITKTILKIAK